MQETDMREKLVKIIQAYEDLQARMGDPAVLSDQKEYNRLAKEYSSQGPLCAQGAGIRAGVGRFGRGQGDAFRPRHEGVRPGGDSLHRGEAAGARRGHQVHAHPVRPGRRQGHHRGDPCGRRRRRGGHLRGRPVQDVPALRVRAGVEDRDHGRFPLRGGRLQGNPVQGQGRPRVLGHEVRKRRAPRAARAQDRKPGTHPHLHGHGGRAAGSRRGGGGDQRERPAHRRVPRRRPGRPVREHHRLGRAHHAPADAAWWCSRRTRSRSCRTRSPP